MRLLITGTPGVGKTAVAKEISRKLKLKVINETQFALQKGIGTWDEVENELEVPVKRLETELNRHLKKHDGAIIEGHLLCETRLKVDYAVLIRVNPELLEMRLERKGYRPEKIMDNVFCEGIDYCKKHLARRYPAGKIIEVRSGKNIKETALIIIGKLKEAGF